MKLSYYFFTICTSLILTMSTQAQEFNQNENKWLKGWSNFDPNKTIYPEAEETLPTIIADDTFLRNDIVYLISGDVYVTSGATLTVQQGTVIRCDHKNPANLIVTKGSKLIAAGSEAYPIVFTSNKAARSRASGDWGGITIAGSGNVNSVSGNGVIKGDFNPQFALYGGDKNDEQTTILKYVRIEFAGNKTKRTNHTNGLSLYGIGSSSIIDHIMISYSAQDSYNFTGGNLDMKFLLSYKAEDDDYEISEGFKGILNKVIAIRHPYITSPKGSYAVEINGYNKDLGYIQPDAVSDVTITNSSLINLSDQSNYMHTTAAVAASNAALIYLHNSKISGFSDVVKFDKSYASYAAIEKAFMMDNSFFNIHGDGVRVAFTSEKSPLDILKYNRFTQNFVAVANLFSDPNSKTIPKFDLKKSMNTYMVMQ